MTFNETIRGLIMQSALYPLISLIPGSVSGAARTRLVKQIFRNQKAKVIAAWPR